jgi:hypothetical protein
MTRIPNSVAHINSDEPDVPAREQRSIDLDGRPAPLLVSVGDVVHEINPWDLRDETCRLHLRDQWAETQPPIDFDIRHLSDWDHDVRFDVLSFITSLDLEYRVHDSEDDSNSGDLFDVVLAMMVDHENITRCERGRRAATETAGLLHAGALEAACSRILSRLQELRVRGFRVEQLVNEARAAAPATEGTAAGTNEPIFVIDILTDAPVPDNLVTPPGWHVSVEGVRGDSDRDGEFTITAPVLIARRLVNIQTETEFLELVWPRPDRWHRNIVERVKVATARDVVQLAALGLPVNSNNAAKLVQYLADFEAVNIEELPCERVSQQLGWQESAGCEGFLWGRRVITGNSQANTTTDTGISDGVPATCPAITFRGADEGDDQLVAGFHARGSFEVWREAIGVLVDFPRVRLVIYASLSAAVLRIVQAVNYILSYSSPTSQGKTTTIRVGASCWGCPDERSPEAAIGTWDATRTWIERAATVLCDHPLILDDTKLASHPDAIARVLYDVGSGRGRGRGSVEGMRGTGTFRTVLLSSGEAPITSFSRDAGTRARVLELWGRPFERADATTAPVVASLNRAILANYGHAGPRLVQFLVENHAHWETWCQNYQSYHQQYVDRAENNSVAARLAGYFAVLELTVYLSIQAGIVPWHADSVVTDLWPVLTAETVEADQAEVALQYIWSWATANQESFNGRHHSGNSAPHSGWTGRWDRNENWQFVGFCRQRVEQLLIGFGFEPVPILRNWADRGWLLISPGRRFYKCRIGDISEDLVAITRETVDRLMGDEPLPPRPRAPRGVVGGEIRREADSD